MSAVESAVARWADRIRPHLAQAVESIVAAGRELNAAKAALPHGQFGPLLSELKITPRTAQRFMAIARHPVLSDATRVSHLPAAWGTLEELTRLPDERLEAAIESGEITPEITRGQARELASPPAPEPAEPRVSIYNPDIYGLPVHPALDLVPAMTDSERRRLVESIAKFGQLNPVIVHDGVLLDGRERLMACHQLGIEPAIEEYTEPEPATVPAALNLLRQSYTPAELAAIETKIGKLDGDVEDTAEARLQRDLAELARLGCRVTSTGLELPEDMPYDDWVRVGRVLARMPAGLGAEVSR